MMIGSDHQSTLVVFALTAFLSRLSFSPLFKTTKNQTALTSYEKKTC